MKIETYEKLITQITNEDTRANAITSLVDQIKLDQIEYDKNIQRISELEQSNNTLRDANSKLALRITENVMNPVNDTTKEQTSEEYQAEFINKLAKEGF